jgi:hypothetical protein
MRRSRFGFVALLCFALSSSIFVAAERVIGSGVTLASATPVGALLADPESHAGQLTRVDGVITEICREHGDWFKLSAPRGGSGLLVEFSDPELALPIDRAGTRISVEGTFEALPLADPPEAETDGQRICPAMTRGSLRYRLRASGAILPAG